MGDDVYAGREGNVYRHTDSGWQQHNSGSGWSNVERSTTMDREWSSRAAGQARAQTYGNSTRSMNRSYGGARRGGGSRRR